MGAEWRQTTLGEVLSFSNGQSSPERTNEGPNPVFGSNGLIGFSDQTNAIDNTIIIGRVGSYCGSLQFSKTPCWVTDNAIRATAKASNSPRFLFYLLEQIDLHRWRGGSGQPLLNQRTLNAISTAIPTPDEQHKIADILGTLDDKIELNRQTNRTLEAMARAIFKAWFVDFEPVKARAAGATSFRGMPQDVFDQLPTRLTESELGPVPEEWEVKRLDECVHLTMGQSPSSKYYNKEGIGRPFYQGVSDYGSRFPNHRVFCTADGRLAEPGDVLVSVRAPVGRINVADSQLVLGRGLAGLRHRRERQSFLLYQLYHIFAVEDAIGDGTIYKAVTKRFLSQMPMLSPPEVIVEAFDEIACQFDDMIASLTRESRTLESIRETLLPKLISGEIQVPEALEGVGGG